MLRLIVLGVVGTSLFWPVLSAGTARAEDQAKFAPLFGAGLEGWRVSDWSNVASPQKVDGDAWKLDQGVLVGQGKRTWLYSEREYGDFAIKFEAKVSRGANGGFGLRFPPSGDPAYTGMEIQIVDGGTYYRDQGRAEQLTGSIYDEVPAQPTDVAKPADQWNAFEITCRGPKVTIVLNGRKVVDADLSKETKARQQKGPPLAERPLKGRIGFQNLSGTIEIRGIEFQSFD
jgi:hypothetical protein